MIPLALYIHFPWCVKKCPYCDFNSHEFKSELPEAEYIQALEHDLLTNNQNYDGRPIQSIFMGGGTPSLFSPKHIDDLLKRLRKHLNFAADIEITLEANPGTTDFNKFQGYREAGVNRLSMGVQSFDNKNLLNLGRIHSMEEVLLAYEAALRAGFTNINLDLMHGLKQQSLEAAIADLALACKLSPNHISWYQLTIEPNTVFYKQPPLLPNEDLLWEIYESGLNFLAQRGYSRYEVSAFSLPGKQAKHNLNYWLFGDYIGIGAGAHGKQTTKDGRIIRTAKTRAPKDYLINQTAINQTVEQAEIPIEFMMNALRLTTGFSISLFEERTNLKLSDLDHFLTAGQEKNLLEVSATQVRPTTKGLQFLNELLMLL